MGVGLFTIAAAVLFFVTFDTVREMPSDRNLSPSREQTIVQVPRPELPRPGGSPAGPDSSKGVEPKASVLSVDGNKAVFDPTPAETRAVLPEEIPVDEEAVYYKAMVFRDEALGAFPVHTVQVHQPKSVEEDIQTGKIGGKNFGPKPNEVWVRIKPDYANQMREIMAQTADLYREYLNENTENIVVVNWVGGQAWAKMEFSPDGTLVTP